MWSYEKISFFSIKLSFFHLAIFSSMSFSDIERWRERGNTRLKPSTAGNGDAIPKTICIVIELAVIFLPRTDSAIWLHVQGERRDKVYRGREKNHQPTQHHNLFLSYHFHSILINMQFRSFSGFDGVLSVSLVFVFYSCKLVLCFFSNIKLNTWTFKVWIQHKARPKHRVCVYTRNWYTLRPIYRFVPNYVCSYVKNVYWKTVVGGAVGAVQQHENDETERWNEIIYVESNNDDDDGD